MAQPLEVPCNSPPWGTLTAIGPTTQDHLAASARHHQRYRSVGTHTNVPLPTGIFNIGGNMVTRGDLIFIGATADDFLRAIDERIGEVVWKASVPAGGQDQFDVVLDQRQAVHRDCRRRSCRAGCTQRQLHHGLRVAHGSH